MCGIWKQQGKSLSNELTLPELDRILSDRLFTKLETININGGEPNLREDLIEIVDLLISKLRRIKRITLNSNGVPPHRTIENAARISDRCRRQGILFSISVSLHDIGPRYDTISGIKGTYEKVIQALKGMQKIRQHNPFYLSVNCVISNLNLHHLEEMIEWDQKNQIPVNFTLGEIRDRFHNIEMAEGIEINEKDRPYLVEFLRKLANKRKVYFQHALRYVELADMMEFSKRRKLACHYAMGGVILGSEGLLYYCKSSRSIGNCRERSAYDCYFDPNNLEYRQSLIEGKCGACPPNTFNQMEVGRDLFRLFRFLLKGNG
jgi:MoaA/NifB/PqqE/SkfB family radical SAM enzyme